MVALHRVLGIGVGGLILLMSVTGGLLVIHHDLERLLFPERHVLGVTAAATRETASRTGTEVRAGRVPRAQVLQLLAAEAPAGYRPLRIETAGNVDETEKYLFVDPDGRTRWAAFVDPNTGAVAWRGTDQALFTPWVLHLHMHLRAGGWGYVITACAGAGLFLLGATGIFLYGGRLGAVWRRPMRLGQGWRVALIDLHRWLGIVSLYFSIVLGLTGAIYAGKTAPGQIAVPKPLDVAFDLRRLAPIEPAVAAAEQRFPGGEITRIAFPTKPAGSLVVTVLHRDAPVWRKFSRMEFDPFSGKVRAVHAAAEAGPREKFAAMLAPLHFGLYGSGLTKAAYAIGGFAPAVLAGSGIMVWWLRRRRSVTARPESGVVAGRISAVSERS